MITILLLILVIALLLLGTLLWLRGQQRAKGLPEAIAEQLIPALQHMTQTLQQAQQTQFAESRQQLTEQLANNQINQNSRTVYSKLSTNSKNFIQEN